MATAPITPSELTNAPDAPPTQEERERVVSPLQAWDDPTALRIVKSDFEYMERYRFQNHDRRFRIADELYLAYVKKNTWEDTKIARSSLPVFLAFQQVEALIPSVVDALFNNEPPFEVEPKPTGTWEQAFMVRELVRNQMEGLDENGVLSLREVICQLLKSSLIYGNGVLEFGWCAKKGERLQYTRKMVPRMVQIFNAMTGSFAQMPTGEYDLQVSNVREEFMVNKPIVGVTDIRDFYIDPHCPSPDVQQASMCATRQYMTVEDVAQYREVEGFNIPGDDVLRKLAETKSSTFADQTKQQQEAFRGNNYSPQQEQTDDPSQKRIEVIRYWRKNRHVWLLNRERVAHNQPNCYQCLPFLAMPYVNVLGRFYGLSIPDLVEGDQRLGEALLNARIDEVNLNVHPPIVRRKGMQIPASARRLRPGVVWEVDGDPSRDVVRMQMGNVTADAHIEFDALERRTQKTTGVTDTGVFGVASAGGNSANRTATGINTQSAASSRRIQFLVENWEDRFMIPLCNVLLALDQRFLLPEQFIEVLGPDGQGLQIDPIKVKNASVKFRMRASDKMRSKGALQAGGMQLIFETLANPAFLEMQAKQGYQLNTQALVALIATGLDIRPIDLFMPIRPEVAAAMNQPSADQVLRMKMQEQRLLAQGEQADASQEADMINAMIGKLVTPDAAHAALGLPAPAAIEAKHKPAPKSASKSKK